MNTKQQVESVLRRMFNGGMMARLSVNKKDAKIFLAIAGASFDPQETYTEIGVNEHLLDWMEGFTDPGLMDHVTILRALVDDYFLLREASGTSYKTNQAIINQTIEPDARSIQPRYIREAVERERVVRKKAFASQ